MADEKVFNHGNMKNVNISEEMRDDFLSYSMSVIIDRALPDVRDGMKPVHRRVVWGMFNAGFLPDKQQVKSANIVGEVMGKYHPHGDTAIYDTMVRMAQQFSYRYPLVDGHGNFGTVDGDGAAAMRYTEARMSKISMQLVEDIKKNTVDFKDNYDARHQEPVVLPSKFPNLLVNGSMGIAVGMATNMPTHNLNEAIDGIIAVIDKPDIEIKELMKYIPGPDFPTGGIIVGDSGIKQAYETGRGSITVRSKVEIKEKKEGKKQLIVTEIPYLVNKQMMKEKIADLVVNKVVTGISDMRDLSNQRNGIRIEIDLKNSAQPEVVLNQLYKLSPLQSSFGINNNVLVDNKPQVLSLREIIQHYIDHQVDVIRRRTKFDLDEDEKRLHIVEGLLIALDNIDKVIEIIKKSKDDDEAIKKLHDAFKLDKEQSIAILDMQLRRLTGLSYDKLSDEAKQLKAEIKDLKDILEHHSRVIDIIKKELTEIKNKFGDERRTQIIEAQQEVEEEDLIPEGNVIISLTSNGYIKRLPINTYRTQNRGGRGVKGMTLNEDDAIEQNITMSTHDHLLIFTNKGKVYRVRGFKIPEASRNAKGIPVINIINIDKDEKVKALVPISDLKGYLFFVTKKGLCKRVEAKEFESIRQTGKVAILLKENDELVTVKKTDGTNQIIIGAANGKAVRFDERGLKVSGRNASGSRGMNVTDTEVIGACTDAEGKLIFVISKNGYGKQTPIEEYRMTSRGAKGVKSISITSKNGPLVALHAVSGKEDAMIMTSDGVVIRISLTNVATQKRATLGVRLIKPDEGSYVKAVNILESGDKKE